MTYSIGSPSITEQEIAAVVHTLRGGRLTHGAGVERFEAMFADRLGVKHAIACSTGTAALHLALAAMGVGPGDEVLVPDLTYVATANAVAYTGATPVLVDVEPSTWNMNLDDAKEKLSARTVAILPVHLYGVPCDMQAMTAFAEQNGLACIEDAAEALGGEWARKPCGTYGICGTFSFYANKVMSTGEGGMVITDHLGLADRLRHLRGQGTDMSHGQQWLHTEIGFNYRMTEMQGVLGQVQLERLTGLLSRRKAIIAQYRDELAEILTFPTVEGTAPWLFTGLLPRGVDRKKVAYELQQVGIETRPVFKPLHQLAMYARPDCQFPVSCVIGDAGISLPTHPNLSMYDVEVVVGHVKGVLWEQMTAPQPTAVMH